MGPDAFEDPPVSQPANTTDNSRPNFVVKEPPNVPPKPRPDLLRPRFGKPVLSENKSRDSPPTNMDVHPTGGDLKPFVPEKREREWTREIEREKERSRGKDVGLHMEVKEAPDLLLTKHESFRTRINPLLQRSSRLRSSLIFSSSKAEMHNSGLGLRPASEEDEQLDSVRTSSIVAQILEKRRVREPFEWRKRAEEKNTEHVQEKDEKVEKEPQHEKNEARFKDENKTKEEPPKTRTQVQSALEKPKDTTPSPLSKTESTTQQYLKDLIAKRKASKMEAESLMKAPEPAEKKPDLTNKPLFKSGETPSTPSASIPSGDTEPKKIDISAKLSELSQRHSVSFSKPPITTPKPVSCLKPVETTQPSKEETSSEGQKKDIFKSLKPLSSPKIFKKAPLMLKALNPRRVSCGEEILTTDATDAEKSELKKNRSQSSSTLPRDDFKEAHKTMGSNTSINTLGEGKAEGKKHWLKGILGSKDKDKKSSADDKARNIVIEVTDETGKNQGPPAKEAGSTITDQTTTNNKTSIGVPGTSRYQSASSSIIFSSNLRDDTKVILEQMSDLRSQKNRAELEAPAEDRVGDGGGKAFERNNSMKVSRFLRPQGNSQEREGLLKRIESLRKEKKVYSRFEVVCCSNEDVKPLKAVKLT